MLTFRLSAVNLTKHLHDLVCEIATLLQGPKNQPNIIPTFSKLHYVTQILHVNSLLMFVIHHKICIHLPTYLFNYVTALCDYGKSQPKLND